MCNAIDDRHIDHPKGSKLVSDACFLSGLLKIETEVGWRTYKKSGDQNKYITTFSGKTLNQIFVIDVTGFMDTKIDSVKAYSSQFFDPTSKRARNANY